MKIVSQETAMYQPVCPHGEPLDIEIRRTSSTGKVHALDESIRIAMLVLAAGAHCDH